MHTRNIKQIIILLAVPNVTAHPSTASVPITVLLHDGPLLCGFNVAITGLIRQCKTAAVCDGDVHLFVCLFVCRQRVLTAARAYRVGHSGRTSLLFWCFTCTHT